MIRKQCLLSYFPGCCLAFAYMYFRVCIQIQFVLGHFLNHDSRRIQATCTTIERLIFWASLSLIWCFELWLNAIGNNNSDCSQISLLMCECACLKRFRASPAKFSAYWMIYRLCSGDPHPRNSIKIMIFNVILCIWPNNGYEFHLNANNNFHPFSHSFSCCEPDEYHKPNLILMYPIVFTFQAS